MGSGINSSADVCRANGALGGYLYLKEIPWVWNIILGISNLVDIARATLSFSKRHRGAVSHVNTLEKLYLRCEVEYGRIKRGKFTADQILTRWRQIAEQILASEIRNFSNGLTNNASFMTEARAEAREYFLQEHNVEVKDV